MAPEDGPSRLRTLVLDEIARQAHELPPLDASRPGVLEGLAQVERHYTACLFSVATRRAPMGELVALLASAERLLATLEDCEDAISDVF